jgi:hypothetical protein
VLRALSVKIAALVIGPVVCGVKLILRLQLVPGASEKLLVQSLGVPEPATCLKLWPTLRPGETAFSNRVPIFWIATDCGLSVLVLPT